MFWFRLLMIYRHLEAVVHFLFCNLFYIESASMTSLQIGIPSSPLAASEFGEFRFEEKEDNNELR